MLEETIEIEKSNEDSSEKVDAILDKLVNFLMEMAIKELKKEYENR